MQNFIKHMPHYISLIFIFIAGIIGFYVFSYDTNFQIGVAFALASAYVSWELSITQFIKIFVYLL